MFKEKITNLPLANFSKICNVRESSKVSGAFYPCYIHISLSTILLWNNNKKYIQSSYKTAKT